MVDRIPMYTGASAARVNFKAEEKTPEGKVKLTKIHARQILDSRGNPTVEVDATAIDDAGNEVEVRAAVPSGASTGKKEACELRDEKTENPTDAFIKNYLGKGVITAVNNVNNIIAPKVIEKGIDVRDQKAIDQVMIDMDNPMKSKLGANAILAVSMAVAKAAAKAQNIPLYKQINRLFQVDCPGAKEATTLPVPMMNIMNGGAHATNNLDIQEFMVVPVGPDPESKSGNKNATYSEALQMGTRVFHNLKSVLKKKNLATGVGDEGGFAPNFTTEAGQDPHVQALETIMTAIDKAGYTKDQMKIALDVASSEFFNKDEEALNETNAARKKDGRIPLPADVIGKYALPKAYPDKKGVKTPEDLAQYEKDLKNAVKTPEEMIKYYNELADKYPIISIEDGMAEDDHKGWHDLTVNKDIKDKKLQLVGDDVFVTNADTLQDGINKQMANSILIKLNQVGTVSETLKTIATAKKAGYNTVISHRSGETSDSTIADLAVGTNAGQIKTGAPSRGERVEKYNQLLRIEEELGDKAKYPGMEAFEIKAKNQ